MGTLLDLASLVVVPSGYKEDVVYSVKPTDGSGDLDFTRSNDTATRVNSAGLIEKVRTNLILQSNGFDTASWTKSGSGTGLTPVVTANAGTAPDGTNNAFRIQFDCVGTTSADRSRITQNITSAVSTQYTYSFYIKAFSAGDVGKQVRFIVESSTSQAVVTLTADWQRIISTGTASSTSPVFLLETRGGVTVSTTADVLLAFTQAETGDIATDYIPTTTAAVSVGPVANVPRLDYSGGGCPKLLLEPQRTNVVLYSEQFDNAWWPKLSASALANDAISPDGFTNADKIRPNSGVSFSILSDGIYTTGASSYIRSTGLTLTAASYTFSAFVKKGEYDHIQLRSGTSIDTITNGSGVVVNLNNGTTNKTSGYTIEDYGDGWYRISHTFTATAATWYLNFWFWNSTSVTANGTDGVYVYGAQLEEGSYPTSYIPTLGAAVTRGADACFKTGISSLIGQTEGTLFFEFNSGKNDGQDYAVAISDGTTNNRVIIYRSATNQLITQVRTGGTPQAQISTSTLTEDTTYKCLVKYAANDVKFYVNGSLIGSDTSATIPTMSRIALDGGSGTANFHRDMDQLLVFPTALTDAECIALTTI